MFLYRRNSRFEGRKKCFHEESIILTATSTVSSPPQDCHCYSFIHTFIHTFIHSFIHSFTHFRFLRRVALQQVLIFKWPSIIIYLYHVQNHWNLPSIPVFSFRSLLLCWFPNFVYDVVKWLPQEEISQFCVTLLSDLAQQTFFRYSNQFCSLLTVWYCITPNLMSS